MLTAEPSVITISSAIHMIFCWNASIKNYLCQRMGHLRFATTKNYPLPSGVKGIHLVHLQYPDCGLLHLSAEDALFIQAHPRRADRRASTFFRDALLAGSAACYNTLPGDLDDMRIATLYIYDVS
jgi:hypothetical protein